MYPAAQLQKTLSVRHKFAGALPCLQSSLSKAVAWRTSIADGENGQQSSLMADIDQTDGENELVVVGRRPPRPTSRSPKSASARRYTRTSPGCTRARVLRPVARAAAADCAPGTAWRARPPVKPSAAAVARGGDSPETRSGRSTRRYTLDEVVDRVCKGRRRASMSRRPARARSRPTLRRCSPTSRAGQNYCRGRITRASSRTRPGRRGRRRGAGPTTRPATRGAHPFGSCQLLPSPQRPARSSRCGSRTTARSPTGSRKRSSAPGACGTSEHGTGSSARRTGPPCSRWTSTRNGSPGSPSSSASSTPAAPSSRVTPGRRATPRGPAPVRRAVARPRTGAKKPRPHAALARASAGARRRSGALPGRRPKSWTVAGTGAPPPPCCRVSRPFNRARPAYAGRTNPRWLGPRPRA